MAAQAYLNSLLAVTNAAFLLVALHDARHVWLPDGAAPLSAAGSISVVYVALFSLSFAGVAMSTHGAACSRTRTATLLPTWVRMRIYILLFAANELLFESLVVSGAASSWVLPNAAGRLRVVHPLRYIAWASTNSYLLNAVSIALRVDARATLAACLGIVLSTLCAFPLELTAVASAPWLCALAVSSVALVVCLVTVARRVAVFFMVASRAAAAALVFFSCAVAVSYTSFPIVFLAAQLCGGGDGVSDGSCLSTAREAVAWRVVEGVGKLSFLGIAVVAATEAIAKPTRVTRPSWTSATPANATFDIACASRVPTLRQHHAEPWAGARNSTATITSSAARLVCL